MTDFAEQFSVLAMHIRKDRFVEFKQELEQQPEMVNTQFPSDGYTLLHIACLFDRMEAVDYLLAKGADATLRDLDLVSPLIWARKKGLFGLLRRLMQASKKVEVPQYELMHSTSTTKSLLTTETCPICWNDVQELHSFGCEHFVCGGCVERVMEVAVADKQLSITCSQCSQRPSLQHIQQFMDVEHQAKWFTWLAEATCSDMADFRWCPDCEAGGVVDEGVYTCGGCQKCFCADCLLPSHPNQDCREASRKVLAFDTSVTERLSQRVINQHHVCPSCFTPTHRTTGCSHIKCICGQDWCYLCGGEYLGTPYFGHKCDCANQRRQLQEAS